MSNNRGKELWEASEKLRQLEEEASRRFEKQTDIMTYLSTKGLDDPNKIKKLLGLIEVIVEESFFVSITNYALHRALIELKELIEKEK